MLDVSADHGTFTRCIRLVIADRQPIALQGLNSVFAAQRDFEIIASCSTGTSCLEAIRNLAPDVALLADTLLDVTASEILAIAKAEHLPTRLVFFTESEGDDGLSAAIAAGACSAISRYATPDIMLRSLRLMAEHIGASPGRSQNLSPEAKGIDGATIEKMLGLLTDRESQVVGLVSAGLSNKEIARKLNISHGTVKVHLHNIFQKLEISNRTVLATIALLQRPAGFGTLALAALAFAILDDVKASETNNTFLDDGSADHRDLEHPVFEVWKKAILRHTVVVDHGGTVALPQGGASIKAGQVANSPARREELHAAEPGVLSSTGRGYGPIGSSAPSLFISPLLQAINNSQTGNPTAQQPFLPPAAVSNPVKSHAGHGAFTMTAAGAWIYALDHSKAAVQAPDPSEALIGAAAATDRTTQVATITIDGAGDAGSNDADNPAPGPVVYAPHPPLAFGALGHESVTGEGNADHLVHGGAGDDILNGSGLTDEIYGGSGNDTIKDNSGDEAISGGSGSESGSGNHGNDTLSGGPGSDRLTGSDGDDAPVHLSAKDSNSTQFDSSSGADKINLAALGALAFLHLTSTSTSVPPHTIAWIYNPASNETIVYVNPTDRSLDIGDSRLLEIHLQGVVSVAESDFIYAPDAAAVAADSESIDPALLLLATASDGTVLTGSADASIEADASESTHAAAGIWATSAEDGFRFHFARDRIGSNVSTKPTGFGDDTPYATEAGDNGATTAPVYVSSIEAAPSHPSVPVEENLTFQNEPAHANSGAATTGHGKANVAAGLESFEFGMQGAAMVIPAAEHVEPAVAPGNSADHGNAQHASNPAATKAAEPAEPGATPGHGNSEQPSHPAAASKMGAAEAAETGASPGNSAGHGNSQHAANPAAAKASAVAEPTEPGFTPGHRNLEHPSYSDAASKMGAAEAAETGASPGNSAGHGNAQHASNPATAKASAAAEPAEPGLTPGHGNSHASHSPPASNIAVAEPIETGTAPGNSAGHGNSQHASQSAAAKTSAAAEAAEAVSGAGSSSHEQAFHFNNQATPAKPMAAVEPEELQDSPAPLSHDTELAAILETGPAAVEEHAAGHGNKGHHQATGHAPHELLI